MTTEQFNALLDELDGTSLQTLKDKNARYTSNSGDALHNFRIGAQADNSTMAQTAWHYWKKHFVALMDKIQTNNWYDREDTLEKIQDSINYLRFIWAISEEERNKLTQENSDKTQEEEEEEDTCCYNCKFFETKENQEPCVSCRRGVACSYDESYGYPLKFQPKY